MQKSYGSHSTMPLKLRNELHLLYISAEFDPQLLVKAS